MTVEVVNHDHRRWAAVLAIGSHAVLSGSTSLALAGARSDSSTIHVLVASPHHVRRPPGGVVVHRTATLPDSHVHWMTQPARTRPGRAVVDAAQWARTDDAARLAVVDAFQRRLVTLNEICTVLGVLPRARRRDLVLTTAHDADGGSHSLAELDYLYGSRRAGLPAPTRQAVRVDSDDRRRYLDVLYEEWRVHVEIDGGQHIEVKAWWDDMKRQNALGIEGIRMLRFPAWALRAHPNEVFAQVRTALRQAGWPG